MPELPEVERVRRLLHDHLMGKTIHQFIVPKNDPKLFQSTIKNLELVQRHSIVDTLRHGKVFGLVLDSGLHVLFHLGMTGSMTIKGIAPFSYKEFRVDTDQWPPKHSRLLIHCDSVECAFTDPRRFGKVWIVTNPYNELPLKNLGPDAFLHFPPLKEFIHLFQGKNKTLKSVLLDQSILSGLGNWMVDDILHEAQLHPSQSIHDLQNDHWVALWHAIQNIVKISVECNANEEEYPKNWLFHSRWQRGKDRKETELKWITVGGRTSVIRPLIQKKLS